MSKINIIYLLPEMKGVSGGAKVIYDHSLILNEINKKVESKILHVKKKLTYKVELSLTKRMKLNKNLIGGWNGKKMKVSKNFTPDKNWYNGKVRLANSLQFNSKNDFVIIPEIFSHFAEDLNLKKRDVKYGIFVQGSYHVNSTENYNKIKSSYENSDIIICSSIDSQEFIEKIFPKCKNKILKFNISINLLKKKIKKKNYISCMQRKLPAHFHLLKFYLKNKLPGNWKIDVIENVSDREVKIRINRSKIFLSFSHFEGLGLPPLEAALAKNKIIGYIGGGGKEYWRKPIFHEIKYGEIKIFGDTILNEIKNYNAKWIEQTSKQREYLIKKYSKESEVKSLNYLSNKIIKFFN